MALEIPKRYIPALNDIRNLPKKAEVELLRALKSSPIASTPSEMVEHISPSISQISRQELERIVDVLYSLYHVREFSELSEGNFLRDLLRGLTEFEKLDLSQSELSKLQERFKKLLSIDTLNLLTKAVTLQRDGERLFCGAKIVSDIRPVFGGNVRTRPVGAAITHLLKLSYHENGDHKEFFVTMDEYDLKELGRAIERAKVKTGTLEQVLSEAKIPRLGI